jgi:transcriptional regulator with XRE-family HTH domain
MTAYFGLGSRIRQMRKSKGLSISQLSALINTSPSAISAWEEEKVSPSAASIRRMCQVVGVSADWLLGLADEELSLQSVQAKLAEALCELQALERMEEDDR